MLENVTPLTCSELIDVIGERGKLEAEGITVSHEPHTYVLRADVKVGQGGDHSVHHPLVVDLVDAVGPVKDEHGVQRGVAFWGTGMETNILRREVLRRERRREKETKNR